MTSSGWGRSVTHPSHRGATGPTPLVHADMTSFLTSTCLPSPSPVFLFGHSMGGAQVLTWLADPAVPAATKAQLRGVLADAPCIALPPAVHPSRLTVRAGRIAAWLAPTRQLRRPIDPNALSRDPDVAKAYAEDELCHEMGTLAGLAGLLERGRRLGSGEVVLREGLGEGQRTRVWVSHGTEDRVCDVEATKRMVARWEEVDDKELRVYEGWFHRLHDEVGECKAQYAGDVAAWILARAGPLEEGRPGVEPKSKL
ncbi:MAG: hypothetical protein M1821_004781 [Bathelium mastoideum]|nr:MAG: hypothetical protein M1821_004781 [Bathelium mastoideum]